MHSRNHGVSKVRGEMSATVKQQLQQELFLPNDERLIAMVPVFKVPRKRKGSYLCAVCKYPVCAGFVITL